MPRLHLIRVVRIQVVSICISLVAVYMYYVGLSCIGDKIVIMAIYICLSTHWFRVHVDKIYLAFRTPFPVTKKRHRTLCSNSTGGYVLGVSSGLATDRGFWPRGRVIIIIIIINRQFLTRRNMEPRHPLQGWWGVCPPTSLHKRLTPISWNSALSLSHLPTAITFFLSLQANTFLCCNANPTHQSSYAQRPILRISNLLRLLTPRKSAFSLGILSEQKLINQELNQLQIDIHKGHQWSYNSVFRLSLSQCHCLTIWMYAFTDVA